MTSFTAGISATGGSRLDRRAASGRPLLACYFTMGDPLFDDAMRDIYAECGVDILELGMPSADPYLDGPDICGTMARAMAGPIDPFARMADVVAWLDRTSGAPAGVCMAYPEIDLARIDGATLNSLDGFLILGREARADHAVREALAAGHVIRECGFVPLDFSAHAAAVAATLDGYVMLQAAVGVTGPRDALDPRLGAAIAELRAAHIRSPLLLGFGIGTAHQARQAIELGADGVVIGSMCVRKVLEGPGSIRSFLRAVRAALDA